MKNLKSLHDIKNLINLIEGFEIGWVAKIKMQTRTGERAQKLLLNFWKKHYDLMIENHVLKLKVKKAEDAYWQVQKMHDLWVEQDKMKKKIDEEIIEYCPIEIPKALFVIQGATTSPSEAPLTEADLSPTLSTEQAQAASDAFWNGVDQAAHEVRQWPSWKRGEWQAYPSTRPSKNDTAPIDTSPADLKLDPSEGHEDPEGESK